MLSGGQRPSGLRKRTWETSEAWKVDKWIFQSFQHANFKEPQKLRSWNVQNSMENIQNIIQWRYVSTNRHFCEARKKARQNLRLWVLQEDASSKEQGTVDQVSCLFRRGVSLANPAPKAGPGKKVNWHKPHYASNKVIPFFQVLLQLGIKIT